MADLLRLAISAYQRSDHEVAQRLLAFVDHALRGGDDYVQNAAAVSFVEHIGAGAGETEGFIASWPAGLLDEVNRQQAVRPATHDG